MCGISGILSPDPQDLVGITHMCDAMPHRGPDDSGVWQNELRTLCLGHRRLSILDLSPEGHQPMHSASGRYHIVFNGEIYNFNTLKTKVESAGYTTPWRGHSDTEILLACVDVFGIEETLRLTNGMFALALYDSQHHTLTLARDRAGEKPLYYGMLGPNIYFCSELKSIKSVQSHHLRINRSALGLYVRHGYVPGPWSIYEQIYKLQPGHLLCLPCADFQPHHAVPDAAKPYWAVQDIVSHALANPFIGDDRDACMMLDQHLKKAVSARMVADVPLGAFLSGGYDSSLIAALMQTQSATPVQTFSIGFDVPGYNEAEHAKAVAAHLGTRHTELYVQPKDALDVIPKLSQIYCEPFADSSQIPTYLVSAMTRQHVTVALSGDGGDELFGGYNRYFWTTGIWQKISPFPLVLRALAATLCLRLSPSAWNRLFHGLMRCLPSRLHVRLPGDKLHKLAGILTCDTMDDIYYRLTSAISKPSDYLLDGSEALSVMTDPTRIPPLSNPIDRMMFRDMVSYLPDDILVKVDRASMAVSLETRIPFLDHHVMAFAWSLPQHFKIRDGQGKWIIKQLAHQYIPKSLMERPKMGFGVPIDHWLRGPLKEWAQDLLSPSRIQSQGYFHSDTIQTLWQEHLSGHRNWSAQLWIILMFQEWLDT